MAWNPEQYLKFKEYRNKPIADLLGHVALEDPKRIIDIGCGPGNSTRFLAQRWPQAEIIGLDSSKEMLETAAQALPQVKWAEADASGDLSSFGMFDLVFSNAALQWMPDHERLIPKLFGMLNPGGVLAVQMPQNRNSPLQQALRSLVANETWSVKLPERRPLTYAPNAAAYYYDILSKLPCAFEIWRTHYCHVLDSHEDILEWYKGTGLSPYLSQLNATDQEAFLADVLECAKPLYPVQADGKVLFEFERLFFAASHI